MKKYPYFKIDLYNIKVNVVCHSKWRDEAQRILKEAGYEKEKDLDTAAGFSMQLPEVEGIHVFFSADVSDDVVYHECIHLLLYVMDSRGLKDDVFNSESIAYLGEYIIENVMKIKRQINKKPKKPKARTIKNPSKRGTVTEQQAKEAVGKTIAERVEFDGLEVMK